MFEMKWVIGPAEDTRWPWRPERRQKHTPLRPVCVKPVYGAGAFREVPRAPDGPAALNKTALYEFQQRIFA